MLLFDTTAVCKVVLLAILRGVEVLRVQLGSNLLKTEQFAIVFIVVSIVKKTGTHWERHVLLA